MLNDKQIKEHYSGIGGSMAASILGFDPYRSNVDAYLFLTNEEFREAQRKEIDNKMCVKIGSALETIIANQVSQDKGWILAENTEAIRDKEHDFLLGHIDREILKEKAILEIKARGNYGMREYGDEDSDQIKDSEHIQIMHYLMLTGYETGYLAVLDLAHSVIRYFTIKRDEMMITIMRHHLVKFWNEHVIPRVPPEPKTYEDACKLFPKSIASMKSTTLEISNALTRIAKIQTEIKLNQAILDDEKTKVAAYLQEHDTLIDLNGNKLCTFKTQNSTRIDLDLLRAKYPKIAEECSITVPSRVMRFSKKGKGGAENV